MSRGVHFGHGTWGPQGSQNTVQALRRSCSVNPTRRYDKHCLRHPLPNYLMWRGNHSKYMYQNYQTAHWGEGEAQREYHQYFAHAKDPSDSNKAHEFEYIIKEQGIPRALPLPKPQIPENSKPTWFWKSWHMPYTSFDIWRRELEYPEHIPSHLGKSYTRPLCVLAPQIMYNQLQSKYMKNITITLCPFMFGYGNTLQKLVTDFYRLCLSVRHIVEREIVRLNYALKYTLPIVEITWLDDTVYRPPLYEGMKPYALIQNIMEESFLVGDRLSAQSVMIPDKTYPDLGKWEVILEYKLSKKAKLRLAQDETAREDEILAPPLKKK